MKQSDFEQIYKRYVATAYFEALNQTRLPDVAEDIAQETMTRLFATIDDKREEDLKGWVKVVARNLSFDYFRNRSHFTDGELKETALCSEVIPEPEDLEGLDKEECCQKFLNRVLDELYESHPEWYYLILMVEIRHRPQEEVAKNIGISTNNLRVRLHRAKKWLRRKYGDEARELGIF